MDAPVAQSQNGTAEEIKDAAAFLRFMKWLWSHKRDVGFAIAFALLLLKGETSFLTLAGFNPGPPMPKPPTVIVDAPLGESWKNSVNRRLDNIEKQQKKIITLLTD